MVIRVLTRYPYACDPFPPEITSNQIHEAIQAELDAQGIDAKVERVKIIRAAKYHYILPDIWTPVESPIAPAIIVAIIAAIKTVIVALVIAYVAWVAFEVLRPKPKYCPYCGEEFPDWSALQAHIREAHPGEPSWTCRYCGLPFATIEELEAHMKECPERPMLEKIPWKAILIVAGIGIGAYLIGKIIALIKKSPKGMIIK